MSTAFPKMLMLMLNSGGDAGVGWGAKPIAPKLPKVARGSAGRTDAAPPRPAPPACLVDDKRRR